MISEITLKFIQMHLSKATGEVMRVISCKIIHNFTGNVRAIQKNNLSFPDLCWSHWTHSNKIASHFPFSP